jgi:hypothetical protein
VPGLGAVPRQDACWTPSRAPIAVRADQGGLSTRSRSVLRQIHQFAIAYRLSFQNDRPELNAGQKYCTVMCM